MSKTAPPVFFFTFADPDQQSGAALPALQNEEAGIRAALATGQENGSWEFVSGFHCKRTDLIETFRNNRVAIFHFGGHSNQQSLWLPAEVAGNQVVDGTLLEEFLSTQPSLQLAFFNSCENQAWAARLSARVPYVIASVCKLDDAIAGHFAAAFYGYLANGSTVEDAFQQASGDVMGTHERSLGEWVDKYKQQPPQFRTFDDADDFPSPAQATFPWVALKRPDASRAGSWKLADAAHDPLIGLPPLTRDKYDLPERPYVTIKGHGQRDAALFFGRAAEIRALADWVLGSSDPARPISLFYGQSGVGKSSLLNAGLLPRLPEGCRVAYRRRGLNLMDDFYGAIAEILGSQAPAAGAGAAEIAAWREAQAGAWLNLPARSLLILDQVEEAITHSAGTGNAVGEELREFAAHVREIFLSAPKPYARLLLSFRKEYLAEIRGYFAEGSTENEPELLDHFWLDRLDHDAIVQVVTGAADSRLTRDKYRIAFPEGDRLPNLVADDLLKGDSPIATVLQILLNELWDAAQPDANGGRSFTVSQYEALAARVNPLEGFFEQQLAAIYADSAGKGAAQGLELDLLYAHTSELATSRRRSLDDLKRDYPTIANLDALITANKDRYLLTEPASDPGGDKAAVDAHGTALAHDTLAPLIRRDFALSDLPGARARRLLENRAREWAGKKHATVLDRADLRTVERGLGQMRAVTEDEQRLIHASRIARRTSLVRSFVLMLLLPLFAVGYLVFWVHSNRQQQQVAIDATKKAIEDHDEVIAIAEALEAERIEKKISWLVQFDPTGTNREINQTLLANMQTVLAYREVYRSRIYDAMVQLDQCAVTLNPQKQRISPLVTSRINAGGKRETLFGGSPIPDSMDSSSGHCDPAGNTIVVSSRDAKSILLWRGGKTQTLQLPDAQSGPMALAPGGSVAAYGIGPYTPASAKALALLDLSTGKLTRTIAGISTGNRVEYSPSGRYLVQDAAGQGLSYIDLSQPNPTIAPVTAAKVFGRAVSYVGGQEAVAFGGKALGQVTDGNLQIRRLSDGKLFAFDTRWYDAINDDWSGYTAVALSPDGRLLAAYSKLVLGQIDLWAVPSTLDPPGAGGLQSADPALLKLRHEARSNGSPLHLDSFNIPAGLWNVLAISPDLQFVIGAQLEQIAEGDPANPDKIDQAAFLHIWQVKPLDEQKLKNDQRPNPLFDTGCGLISEFIADMAADPAMLGAKSDIDYPALKKACKNGVRQQNAFKKAENQKKQIGTANPPHPAAGPRAENQTAKGREKAGSGNAASPEPARRKRRENR